MHQLPKIPVTEITQRIQHFQQQIHSLELDGAFIAHNVDLFYLTGTMQNGLLYVPSDGQPQLFIKKSVDRARYESSLPIQPIGNIKELGKRIEALFGKVKRIGMEMDVLPYKQVMRYLSLFPQAEAIDISVNLRSQRAVKSDYELAHIRSAAKIVNQVFESLPTLIQPGISELELAAKIEHMLRLQGNQNLYRLRGFNQELVLGMVAAGSAAATPSSFDGPAGGIGLSVASPQGASRKKIEVGEPILIDIGTVCEGYLIDQTRLAVIGELDADLEQAYQVARNILTEVEQLIRPGVIPEDVYEQACRLANDAGLRDHFMGFGEDQAKFLGHGVGLELDELPVLAKGFKQPLLKGMVIAIEPKFTFPGRGVIGLENTYVVTENGCEALSLSSEEIIKIKR